MAPYEALYGQKYRSLIGVFEVGEKILLGPDVVQPTIDKVKVIQDQFLAAQSLQNFYLDNWHRDKEFDLGDWVFLMVSPMKGIMRASERDKLRPRYIGPYQIT